MGGESKQTQTQNSTTNPWEAATPALKGILSQVQGQLGNTGLTGNESGAINSLVQNAGQASQFAPQIQGVAQNLLSGGGAMDQAGSIGQNYQRYQDRTNPLASNVNYNPYDTPGFRDAINTKSRSRLMPATG